MSEKIQIPPEITIRPAQTGDGEFLKPILETWIRNSETGDVIEDEVQSVVSSVEESANGNHERQYFIAEEAGGRVLGMVGIREPDALMAEYTQSDNPTEIINAFVDSNSRGRGIGSKLFDHIESVASAQGRSEVILNSGPRYKNTAHGFYNGRYGQPTAVINDHYGTGVHAPVWRKEL